MAEENTEQENLEVVQASGQGDVQSEQLQSVAMGEASTLAPSEAAPVEAPNAADDIIDEDPEIDEESVKSMPAEQKEALVEALLFAHGDPISVRKLQDSSKLEEAELQEILEHIARTYKADNFGFELVCVADQYQFRTKSRFGHFVRALKASTPRRLSNAALETLSIIAYRQPIVKSDVERIRGVDAAPTIKTLLERGLVKIVGHQPSVGLPALYGTTDDFLKLFGLSSLSELPTLRDLRELERDPGETGEEHEVEEVVAEESSASPSAS